MQPEKNSISMKRKKKCCTPFFFLRAFFFLGRTERADRTATHSFSFDVDGRHRRRMWTPMCRGMCKIHRPYCFGWRGRGFCMDPNTHFYTSTERMTTSSLVPFRSFPCPLKGVKTRPPETETIAPLRANSTFLASNPCGTCGTPCAGVYW